MAKMKMTKEDKRFFYLVDKFKASRRQEQFKKEREREKEIRNKEV